MLGRLVRHDKWSDVQNRILNIEEFRKHFWSQDLCHLLDDKVPDEMVLVALLPLFIYIRHLTGNVQDVITVLIKVLGRIRCTRSAFMACALTMVFIVEAILDKETLCAGLDEDIVFDAIRPLATYGDEWMERILSLMEWKKGDWKVKRVPGPGSWYVLAETMWHLHFESDYLKGIMPTLRGSTVQRRYHETFIFALKRGCNPYKELPEELRSANPQPALMQDNQWAEFLETSPLRVDIPCVWILPGMRGTMWVQDYGKTVEFDDDDEME